MFKSTDGAAHWTLMVNGLPPPAGATGFAIDPANPTTLYVGVPLRVEDQVIGVYKSTDGAANWTLTGALPTRQYVGALAPDPTGTPVYAGTQFGGVAKSGNGGVSWRPANNGLVATRVGGLTVDTVDPSVVYAAVWAVPPIFKSTDNGNTWRPLLGAGELANTRAVAVDPLAHQTVYLGGGFTGVQKSTDAGVTWVLLKTGLPTEDVTALAVDPSSEGTVYAATSGKGVYKTTDGGATWTVSSNGLSVKQTNALVVDPTDHLVLYAGAFSAQNGTGGVFKSTDGGASWTQQNSGLTNKDVHAFAFDATNTQIVYAGTSGGLFRTADGGAHWTKSLDADVVGVVVDPTDPLTVYAAASSKGVYVTTDGGVTWTTNNAGLRNLLVQAMAIDPVAGATVHAGFFGAGVFELQTG